MIPLLDRLRSLQLRHLPLQLLDPLSRRVELLDQVGSSGGSSGHSGSRCVRAAGRHCAGDRYSVLDIRALQPPRRVTGVTLLRVCQLIVQLPPTCDDACKIHHL